MDSISIRQYKMYRGMIRNTSSRSRLDAPDKSVHQASQMILQIPDGLPNRALGHSKLLRPIRLDNTIPGVQFSREDRLPDGVPDLLPENFPMRNWLRFSAKTSISDRPVSSKCWICVARSTSRPLLTDISDVPM